MRFGYPGVKPSHPDKLAARSSFAEHPGHKARAATGAPPSAYDLLVFQPPIFDQDGTGTCFAHATSAAISTAFAAGGEPLGYIPSMQDISTGTRALERAAATPPGNTLPLLTDTGAEIADVMTYVGNYGITTIGPAPSDGRVSDITPGNVNDEPDLAELEKSAQKLVAGEYTIPPSDPVLLASAIAQGYPIVIGFFCDSAFENLAANGVAGVPNTSDPNGGGHAVYLSGYRTNAAGRLEFRLTNSWGISWCDGGKCWVSEEFMAAAWEAWPMAVAKKGAA